MTTSAGPSRRSYHDYTEGASPIDINAALQNTTNSRRMSQDYSNFNEDEEGAVFSGPGHSVNPSSVSRMSHIEAGRRSFDTRSRSRRLSRDSGYSGRPSFDRRRSSDNLSRRSSIDAGSVAIGDDEEDALMGNEGHHHGKRRRDSRSTTRPGILGGIASLFGKSYSEDVVPGRRRSASRASSSRRSRRSWREGTALEGSDEEREGDERWGYSSNEEDSETSDVGETASVMGRDDSSMVGSVNYDSDVQDESSGSHGIPLISTDPIFGGDIRIEMDIPFATLDPPPPGPPSRQEIYVPDEDSTIRFVGYEIVPLRTLLWKIGCIFSFGILALLGHWFPKMWLRWATREKAFKDSKDTLVMVESAHADFALVSAHSLEYPYPLSTVFPNESVNNGYQQNGNGKHIGNGVDSQEADILKNLLVLDHRYSRYALDPRNGLFTMIREWRDSSLSMATVQNGLSEAIRKQRLMLFGNNEIDIQAKSTVSLLVDEVIHPFYVFQIASIILWSLDDYYYYAFCIALISISSIVATLLETRKTIERMREMSRFSCKVDVLINGQWVERDSTDLVPGDVVNLSNSQLSLVPADLFLLTGDAILNESMLTGESVPVSKVPLKEEDLKQWKESKEEAAKSMMFGGTKVIRIRGSVSADGTTKPSLALVARTGFSTTKGALVRSMLFPKPIGFKFYRDSIRFIGVLAAIAGIGFSFSAVQFVRMGLKWHTILIRALDLITVVVPPALPATLSIGTSFAITRLRKAGIFCISPSRVNVAGKINVCCFDKTGTLTEDGLDILGIRGMERNVQRFGELLDDIHDLPMGSGRASFLYALATCHSLKMVDGAVIGDPLDIKMFEFTNWTLEEGTSGGTGVIKNKGAPVEQTALVQNVVRPPGSMQFKLEDALKGSGKFAHFLELGVIRTFEFVSSLRRMSVIVKRLKSSSMEVYVKGAPEVITGLCDPDSLPQDFEDLLLYYTKRGYRVIAMAGKSIEGLTWLKAQRLKREQAESGLRFLGLIIFENRIKPGTAPAIQALQSAHMACRMITGDNPLTAVSVARDCYLINQASYVFAPTFLTGNQTTPESQLEWSCMDDTSWKLDSYSLKPLTPPPHHTVDAEEIRYQDYALVVTGDVFRWMINYAPLETLQRMLVKAQIFARMSPDEKNEVVERLQGLGYTVLMCGDGANDCAALKAADVGISLSEAEASVAAPFTSNTPDIGCVIEVIKQGRAALVTSFSCFKYMALYSLIQFISVTLLYAFASSLGDFQFLYIDLFIIIPVAVAMGRTLPYPKMHPKPPTASLVSKKVLVSIIGQIIIMGIGQLWAYLWVQSQSWYTPPPPNDPGAGDKLESHNWENTVLFLVSCFQYILVAAVFSIGPPYRKSMWTNGWLMACLVILTGINIGILLKPIGMVSTVLDLMPLPFDGRLTLLWIVIVNVVLSTAFEELIAQRIAKAIGIVQKWHHGRRRVHKAYKVVEGGMR